MSRPSDILLAFYGDDLTGSTDALEFISKAGVRSVLFLEPPSAADLRKYPGVQAYGVAGLTRSLSPEAMEQVLVPAFSRMKEIGARHVHYKVCSTFDSSEKIGSIGRAIDCGSKVFENDFVPVLGGMPALGRYCVFGNLFARMGIGSNGSIFRLDRHPSMSVHPVTPSDEADLRRHLGRQTSKSIGLIDILQIQKGWQHLKNETDKKAEVMLLDALNEEDLYAIGFWLDELAAGTPLFSVGSSGIEMGLGHCWQQKNSLKQVSWTVPVSAEPTVVLSGSRSPVTQRQVDRAVAGGFAEIALGLSRAEDNQVAIECDVEKIISILEAGQSVVVHTGFIEGMSGANSAEFLGTALGEIGKRICERVAVKRMVVAGGDTSSYAARTMKIDAIEMIAPIVSGAPLCRAHSANQAINGLEINFKGGQVGEENYFLLMKQGSAAEIVN